MELDTVVSDFASRKSVRKKPGSTTVAKMPSGATSRLVAAHREEIDDVPGALLAHLREDGAGHVQQTKDVRAKFFLHIVGADFLNAAEDAESVVVDENVNASESGDAGLDRLGDGGGIAHVEVHSEQALGSAKSAGDIRRLATRANDPVASIKRRLGDECAEATRRSGDEPNF